MAQQDHGIRSMNASQAMVKSRVRAWNAADAADVHERVGQAGKEVDGGTGRGGRA